MKKWLALIMILGWVSSMEAQVILPESGRLAGALDPVESEYGDEFFNFGPLLGDPAPAGQSLLNGWIEFEFGEPEGSLVEFTVRWDSVGTREEIEFGGGQRYQIFRQQVLPSPIDPSTGVLNLETGVIEDISIEIFVRNLAILQYTRINRVPPDFPNGFPPTGNLPPFPPGFIVNEAAFSYDGAGRITGFEFIGQTVAPGGLAAANNDVFGAFPFFSWGPNGETYFPNPVSCAPGTPDENCPTDENNPDGIELPLQNLLHPHFFLRSDRLVEVPVEPLVPPCAPAGMPAGGVLTSAGGKLYHIGGRSEGQVSGRVDIYDPQTNTWSRGPSMPFPTGDAQGVAVGSKIYVLGGRRYTSTPASSRVQMLDTDTGEWSRLADMPTPVALGAAAAFGDQILVIGGRTNRPNGSPAGNLRFSGVLQTYEVSSDSWLEEPAVVSNQDIYVERPAAVNVGSRIYVAGGLEMDGDVTARTLILDVLTRTFSNGTELFWPVYDAASGLLGDWIIVAGGRQTAEGPSTRVMQLYDLTQDAWLRSREAPVATSASNGAMMGGQLWLAGVRSMGLPDPFPGPGSAAVAYYDQARGWQSCDSQPIFNSSDILNTASLGVGPLVLSPGSQASLVGLNLAPVEATAADDELVPTELAGVSLTVNGSSAPILAVSPDRIDFQIPYDVAVGGKASVELLNAAAAQQAPAVEIPVVEVSPGIFIQSCGVLRDDDFLDTSSAIVCKSDGTLAYMGNAIPPGDVALLQMTGLGPVEPPLANGERAPETPPTAVLTPTITVRGENGEQIEAEVISVRLAPGEIGIYDVEFVVPPGSRVGNRVLVEATLNGVSANRAMIPVGEPVKDNLLSCVRDTFPPLRLCFPGTSF